MMFPFLNFLYVDHNVNAKLFWSTSISDEKMAQCLSGLCCSFVLSIRNGERTSSNQCPHQRAYELSETATPLAGFHANGFAFVHRP